MTTRDDASEKSALGSAGKKRRGEDGEVMLGGETGRGKDAQLVGHFERDATTEGGEEAEDGWGNKGGGWERRTTAER